MWTCDICGREFKRKNQSHSCKSISTIDQYIAMFSSHEQEKLKQLRKIINKSAPEAVEKISWKMPTYIQHGNLVHFAMHKDHIGFYVGSTAVNHFEEELENFYSSKGTIRLPRNGPLPNKLIESIVKFKVEHNKRTQEI